MTAPFLAFAAVCALAAFAGRSFADFMDDWLDGPTEDEQRLQDSWGT